MLTLELMFVVSDVTSYDNWSSADSAVSSMHSPTYEVIITYCLLTVSLFEVKCTKLLLYSKSFDCQSLKYTYCSVFVD